MRQHINVTVFYCIMIIGTHSIAGDVYHEKLFPFGPDHGDITFERDDDRISESIQIPVRFPFFDHMYDEIKIQTNGMILFGKHDDEFINFTPVNFPINNIVCVAPFWADVITANDNNSNIFYREIVDKSTLHELMYIIEGVFSDMVIQPLLWGFVATWYEVPGYGLPSTLRNTFQAIVMTNGINSFSIFNYGQLQWTSSSVSGSVHAQAGFNAGDMKNYFLIDKSFTLQVTELVKDSNIQYPGRFVFSIGANITDTKCHTADGLQIVPFRGSPTGGYEIQLFGICFKERNYQIKIDQTIRDDCNVTLFSIKCIMPMIYNGPKIEIQLFTMEKVLMGITHFFIEIPEDNSELLVQNSNVKNSFIEMAQNDSIIFNFTDNFITKKYIFNIELFYYETIFAHDTNELIYIDLRQRTLYSSVNLSSLMTVTIEYSNIFKYATHDDIHITLLLINFNLLTDVITIPTPLIWLYRTVNWPITVVKQTAAFCEKWQMKLVHMPSPATYQTKVPSCPCRVPATGFNRFPSTFHNFKSDPSCNNHRLVACTFDNHVSHCYRRSFESEGPGVKCCYNSDGLIITDPTLGTGGLELEASSDSSIIQRIKHILYDHLPFYTCCERPKLNKNGTHILGAAGDPHFTTLDDFEYTFNGCGEYVLLRTHPLSNATSLEIQIRTKPIQSNVQENQATAIVAFVIKNGNYSKVQFELFPELKLIDIRLNDRSIDTDIFFNPSTAIEDIDLDMHKILLATSRTIRLDNHQISITQTNQTTYTITYVNNIQFLVKIREQYDFLNIISILPQYYQEHLQGLLGNMNENKNNDLSEQYYFNFGESWRITPETTLFYYIPGENFHKKQNLHYRPIFHKELFQQYQNTQKLIQAEYNCQNILSHIKQQQCIYDILITNDSTMKELHENFQRNLHEWKDYTMLVQKDHLQTTLELTTILNQLQTYSYINMTKNKKLRKGTRSTTVQNYFNHTIQLNLNTSTEETTIIQKNYANNLGSTIAMRKDFVFYKSIIIILVRLIIYSK
ncbi:hypothetical protein I4U23_003811 [Adineta vaga]|nr:hypothetical protein I4U23_003811 [Adineta vaga]